MALSSLAAYGDSDSEESTHEDEKDTHKKVDVQTKELMTLRRTKETAKRAGTVQITLPQITKVSLKLNFMQIHSIIIIVTER